MDERTEIAGEPSFGLMNSLVELFVTERGAQMAPVHFFPKDANPVQPYHLSPWQGESREQTVDQPAVLRPLRGDFFCMPFGDNDELPDGIGEHHPPHGESAGSKWNLVSRQESADGRSTLELELSTSVRPGSIRATWQLTGGDSCIYTRHRIAGNRGPVTLGHHATLTGQNGQLQIKSSPLLFGMTNAYQPPFCHDREYYSLASGAFFDDLSHVPTIWKDPAFTDCSHFPAREGFVDILQLCQRPSEEPGWMTALCREGGYLWFSFKNLRLLPSTVIWMENRGRHMAPWSGRNVCIGLEDVCGYLAQGLDASAADNPLSRRGLATTLSLEGKEALSVSYIQGVIRLCDGFDEVDTVLFSPEGATFLAKSGKRLFSPVRWRFLFGEDL
ncbi:hypothetical protein [Sediminispirochaeta bajacaliforniensis]|uniref:hypothetical protein n=1 Tax=Sediminispirochaeta bajacaliforniensis TaxID=148 RepID=UPI0003716A39|nr:hypothetical protein [Sediminispirochaeta bajacaliforniensis]